MGVYILRRLLWMIPTLVVISIVSFGIIQLPPGDYVTSHLQALRARGTLVRQSEIDRLRKLYHLDDPFVVKYAKWFNDLLPFGFVRTPDGTYFTHEENGKEVFHWEWPRFKWPYMGWSLEHEEPVGQLISERLLLTVLLSLLTMVFTWAIAIPIGIYSAIRQYSFTDYLFTFLGFLGLAVPAFLLALVLMYVAQEFWGMDVGGLFSPDMNTAPWSWAKFGDLMSHIWVAMIVLGISGTAGMIRILRGNLLDELRKQYVITARAKGLPRIKLLLKYPVRIAVNPIISTMGWLLPGIVSGSIIVAVVMNLPMVGPLLLRSLQSQDMYMAGSMVMLMAFLTVIGTLMSDILLVIIDPRIRFEAKQN